LLRRATFDVRPAEEQQSRAFLFVKKDPHFRVVVAASPEECEGTNLLAIVDDYRHAVGPPIPREAARPLVLVPGGCA
jgi:hypothetical protein